MGKGLGVALGLVAAVFMVLGAGWLIAPAVVAPRLGMTLQEAVGLSTQIGDLGSFFLTVGVCTLIAQVTGKRLWFHPAIMLLGLAALGRVVAWLFHDAALALDMIAVEAAVTALLVFAATRPVSPAANEHP